jgi:hypothetical protein
VGAPLTCSCDVSGCCETPVSHKCDTHDDGTDFSDIAAARREGVIEGLEWALACVDTRGQQTRPLLARVEILRAELERLREEKP